MPWSGCRAGGPFERVSVADGGRPGKAGSRRIRVVGGVPLGRLRRRVARTDGRIEGKYEPAPWRSGGSGSAATSERNASTSVPKMHDAITDVAGIEVGHFTDADALTGCTAVL